MIIPYGPSNRLPSNWQKCEGQMLKAADYPALFKILGVRFGTDGAGAFALPKHGTPILPADLEQEVTSIIKIK